MLPGDLYRIQAASAQIQHHRQGEEYWATCTALTLYRCARRRGRWAKVWAAFMGRPGTLLDFDAVRAACTLGSGYHAGMRAVPIGLIRGSEGRCQDFDAGFRPLRPDCRDRWVRIAVARLLRTLLPPVTLTLVGDRYFVVDGHHRISVARALGQTEIDGEVTVCEFAGPLPWEQPVPARFPVLSRVAGGV